MKAFLCADTDVVPRKFHLSSGLREHEFMVNNYRYVGDLAKIPGWPCDIRMGATWHAVYLRFSQFAPEVEALAILSELTGETEREGRYIRIHSAYEAVVAERDSDLSAIRHLLAHPVVRLTRQGIRKSLKERFGTLSMNLREYEHQKEFYRCIGQMLIAIDRSVHARALRKWGDVIMRSDNIDGVSRNMQNW